MERLLVVRCPYLFEEHEHGAEARAFGAVVEALEAFATRVDPVRPGVCAVPTRGPSRYHGGDAAVAGMALEAVTQAVAGTGPAGWGARTGPTGWGSTGPPVGVGIADGLFAAVLAAGVELDRHVVVPPGESPAFLAPWPPAVLGRPELADLLVRLGVRTLGQFASLPGPTVLARFGADGAVCQQVARGAEGELPGLRVYFPARPGAPGRPGLGPGRSGRADPLTPARQAGFWGDTADADARAARAVADVQALLRPEAVVRGRVQGGRGPGERARLVTWAGVDPGHRPGTAPVGEAVGGPWPGQIPPPAPAVVLGRPLPALLSDAGGDPVAVSGDGTASATPARLSVDGGPWVDVARWAGPWPADERWWSARRRRRQARIQVVTVAGTAHLLTRERGAWWLEATYD